MLCADNSLPLCLTAAAAAADGWAGRSGQPVSQCVLLRVCAPVLFSLVCLYLLECEDGHHSLTPDAELVSKGRDGPPGGVGEGGAGASRSHVRPAGVGPRHAGATVPHHTDTNREAPGINSAHTRSTRTHTVHHNLCPSTPPLPTPLTLTPLLPLPTLPIPSLSLTWQGPWRAGGTSGFCCGLTAGCPCTCTAVLRQPCCSGTSVCSPGPPAWVAPLSDARP